ncbi:MlaD family protein [Jongsikchunia kroppenstedtii]|uniref:MlaD family protein n=1 Tax=Jongsikchunia kroppenstedtii TaxID=1121721 RepID=UPI00035EAC3F|nr:MlaD family protein [Jongsikchunia kroppenstedtii]
MSGMHQDFIKGTDAQQRRVTVIAALVVVAVVVVTTVAGITLSGNGNEGSVHFSIDTPNVAPGVKPGTKVILHGAEVGSITDVTAIHGNQVRLAVRLADGKARGLTDSFSIDFRPANYFGVTALNLTPGTGGGRLHNDQRYPRISTGDYTMSTMIERGSIIAVDTLSNQMVQILDKVLQYTDGLTPLMHAGLIFTDLIAKTQKALPANLIQNADAILDTTPDFMRQTIDGMFTVFQGKYNRQPDGTIAPNLEVLAHSDQGLALGSGSLFSAVGKLLKSHSADLTPAVTEVKAFSDVVPGMLDGGSIGPNLRTVLARLTAAFGGTGGNPSLRLRIIVDDLPSIAAPLSLAGLIPQGRP